MISKFSVSYTSMVLQEGQGCLYSFANPADSFITGMFRLIGFLQLGHTVVFPKPAALPAIKPSPASIGIQ